MPKELEGVNFTPNQERQPQQQSGDHRDRQNVQGKALQMNNNSVGGKGPAPSTAAPQQGPVDRPDQHKVQGKALQVNENSVEDQDPAGQP